MKIFKIMAVYPYLYIVGFLLFMNNTIYAQTLSINPSEQNLAVEGGTQISAQVTFLNQSLQYPINYKVSLWSGGNQGGFNGSSPILNQNLSLGQGHSQHHTYNFSHFDNNPNNVTKTYIFKVVWTVQNGLNIEATSYFRINVIFVGSGCPLSPPTTRNVGNILSTSAVLWWESHPNEYQYKVRVRDALTSQNYYFEPTTNNYYELNNLSSNRSYYWAVKTICQDGSESNWSNIDHSVFTTQPSGCLVGANFDKPISSSKDVRASGKIYAYSNINPNLDVKFRGSEIILRPGFSVKGQSTGTFRAYVDPCVASKQKMEDSIDGFSGVNTKVLPTLFPNPVSNLLNIENIEEVNDWTLVDMYGKVMNQGKTNSNQSKITINTNSLKPGIYYFNATLKNGELFQKTVMKK